MVLLMATTWWLGRGPREPVFKGRKLSWWLTEPKEARSSPPQPLTEEELRSLGPAAVKWLGYMAGQSGIEDIEEPSSQNSVIQYLWGWHQNWFGEGATRFSRLRFESVAALGDIGPDAAPAIPSLLKAVRCPQHDTRLVAAQSLMRVGDAAWPAITSTIRNGDRRSRWLLLDHIEILWSSYEVPWRRPANFQPADFARTMNFLIPLTLDADEDIRACAKRQTESCIKWWSEEPDGNEGIGLMVEGMERFNPAERQVAALVLISIDYPSRPAEAIQRLIPLAKTGDPLTRAHLLGALAVLDTGNTAWADEIHNLEKSADPQLSEALERALIHFGL